MTFQGDSGVTPDLATNLGDGKLGGSRALRNTIPGSPRPDAGSLRPDSRDPGTETGNLETDTGCLAAWWPLTSRGRRIFELVGFPSVFYITHAYSRFIKIPPLYLRSLNARTDLLL